jgi:predicted amidohydrolase
MLIDPMGVVKLDLGPFEGLGVGDVNTDETARVRAALPCLANRRADILAS